jgi:hypothetical protein
MVDGQNKRDDGEDDAGPRSPPRATPVLRGWKKWLAIIFGLFFLIGGLASIASVYFEVRAGRGGELRRSMWGYKVSPIGILVAVGATAAVFPIISLVERFLHWRDRAWDTKHPRKPT